MSTFCHYDVTYYSAKISDERSIYTDAQRHLVVLMFHWSIIL